MHRKDLYAIVCEGLNDGSSYLLWELCLT